MSKERRGKRSKNYKNNIANNNKQLEEELEKSFDLLNNGEERKTEIIKVGELELRNELVGLLFKMGFRANLIGFEYIIDGIIVSLKLVGKRLKYEKELLPIISEEYKVSSQSVGNAIRHSIEDLWNIGRIDEVNKAINMRLFYANQKPSSSVFLTTLIKLISLRYVYIDNDFTRRDK